MSNLMLYIVCVEHDNFETEYSVHASREHAEKQARQEMYDYGWNDFHDTEMPESFKQALDLWGGGQDAIPEISIRKCSINEGLLSALSEYAWLNEGLSDEELQRFL